MKYILKLTLTVFILLLCILSYPYEIFAACNFHSSMTSTVKNVTWTSSCTISSVEGVDNASNTEGSSANTAELTLGNGGAITINNGGYMVASKVILSGGNISISSGGYIKPGGALWVSDADADGWATSSFPLYTATAAGRRRLSLMRSFSTADCGDGSYSITNSCQSAPFGDGADGAITITSNTDINTTNKISGRSCADGGDAVNYSVTALTSTTATLSTTPSSGCLAAGDDVLLINLHGIYGATTNVGNYEILTISGVSTNTITFSTSKTNYYGDGASNDTNVGTGSTNQRVMLQRLPNYTNVTVNSGYSFSPSQYSSSTGRGGVIAFKASGTVTVNGTIHAYQRGYPGGVYTAYVGHPGESIIQDNSTTYGDGGSASGGTCPGVAGRWSGGGGGGWNGVCYPGGTAGSGTSTIGAGGGGAGGGSWPLGEGFVGVGGGGGGGGHASYGYLGNTYLAYDGSNGTLSASGAGGNGRSPDDGCPSDCSGIGGGGGGGAGNYGITNLSKLTMGSGGGSGGFGSNGTLVWGGTAGGYGGGIILIQADTITVNNSTGYITAYAANGTNTVGYYEGSGGGGAGGSIMLYANTATLGTNRVYATGGTGGTSSSGYSAGGNGSTGRIAVRASSPSGTTNPTYVSFTPFTTGTYDDNQSVWGYSGEWIYYTNTGPYNSTLHYSQTVGNYVQFQFTGTQFVFKYTGHTNRGVADVYVDGALATSLNQYAATLTWQKTWTSPSYDSGTHTVKIVHASGTVVDLDSIQIN